MTPTAADYEFTSISSGLSLGVISSASYKVTPARGERAPVCSAGRKQQRRRMARDARGFLASFFSTPFLKFRRKTELLAYLFLCVSKMPFIPPVSVMAAAAAAGGKAVPPKEGASVKERLASNLKQLGKKSHLPTAARGLSEPRKKGPSSCGGPPESLPASRSGESLSKTRQVRNLLGNSNPV